MPMRTNTVPKVLQLVSHFDRQGFLSEALLFQPITGVILGTNVRGEGSTKMWRSLQQLKLCCTPI
eukprot:1800476-Amphidinium_carterae.1